MPRKAKNWTPSQGKWDPSAMVAAMADVKDKKLGIRAAAKQYGVPKSTLAKRISKGIDADQPAARPSVFNTKEENILVKHLQDMESLGFGLNIHAVCELAFELAEQNSIPHRFNRDKRAAGYDWYQGFMARHPVLSLRKPEGLSAARAAMLNPNVISDHFDKLGAVMDKYELKDKPGQIYNLDETGLSLVHTPSKVIASRGKKTVQSRTSGDRGENVSVLICANAQGTVCPPFIIFKGKRLNPGLTAHAPPGTLFGCSDSSFINATLFETWFTKMFIPSLPPVRPVLLILDGHYSHITLTTLQTARDNEIQLYCLPPHTTNHTQPLDKSVFRSVKVAYNKRCETFMRDNPLKVITRYNFCEIFRDVFQSVLTMGNVISGFKSTGIYPFNPRAITAEHMQFSSVDTDLQFEDELPPAEEPVTIPVTVSTDATGIQVNLPNVLPLTVPPVTNNEPMDTDIQSLASDAADHSTSADHDSSAAHATTADRTTPSPTVSRSNSSSPRFEASTSVLKKPAARKIIKKGNSNRVTEARCLTSDEIFAAEIEKQKKKQKALEEKEARKQERELKRQQREKEKQEKQVQKLLKQKEKEEKEKQKENEKQKKTQQTYSRDDSNNYCGLCEEFVGDDVEPEDWYQCMQCEVWYHESCTGKYGKKTELLQFVCNTCNEK